MSWLTYLYSLDRVFCSLIKFEISVLRINEK